MNANTKRVVRDALYRRVAASREMPLQSSRRSSISAIARSFAVVVAVGVSLATQSAQAQITWAGTSGNWATPGAFTNSAGAVSLANNFNQSLVFTGASQTTSTNTLTNGTVTGITFNSDGFVLNGNAVAFSAGSITNNITSGTNTINLNMTLTGPRTITGSGGSTLVIGGTVSGAGGFTTGRLAGTGTSTFILSGNNSQSGQMILSQNTRLVLGHASALGSGELRFRNGFLDVTGAMEVSSPLLLDPNGNTATFEGSASLSFTGPVRIGTGNVTISVSANTLTLKSLENQASITPGAFTKTGGGTLVITDAAQPGFTRTAITLNGGILRLGNAAALGTGTVTLQSGRLQTGSVMTIANPIVASGGSLGGTNDFTLSGTITGASALNKIDSNTVTLSATNSYTGVTGIAAGVMLLDTNAALPGGIGNTGGTSNLALGLVGQQNDGVIGLKSGTFARAPGTTFASVNMQYGGGFAAYGSGVAVNLGGSSASREWGASNFLSEASAILVLGASDATHTIDFQNPLATGTTPGDSRTIKVNNGAAAVDAVMSGAISITSGSVKGITKTGLGTLALTAANTYTGTTTISEGTLQIGNNGETGSISNSSPVTVSSGATLAFFRSNNISYSGTVSGAGGLTQQGGGILTLGAPNTYTGSTIISSGTIATGVANAISGSSAITIGSEAARGVLAVGHNLSMSSLTFTGSGGDVNVTTGTVTFSTTSGSAIINVFGGTNAFHPDAVLSSPTLVDVASDAQFTFHNNLFGGASLTKSGAGTMVLDGVDGDELSGDLFITGGRVNVLGGMRQLGSGTVTLTGGSILDLNGQEFTNFIDAAGGTILNAGGTATTTTITGPTTISSTASLLGTYNIASTGSAQFDGIVGNGASLVTVRVNYPESGTGAQAVFADAVSGSANITVFAGGTARFDGTVSGDVISHGATTFNAGVFSEVDVKSGGAATFVGSTGSTSTVTVDAGGVAEFRDAVGGAVVVSGSARFTPASSLAGLLTTGNGGIATLDNAAVTAAAIHNDGTLAFIRSSGTQSVASLIDGDGSLVKEGAGVLSLTGPNSYTGPTAVLDGMLVAGNSTAFGTGTVTLDPGASIRIEQGAILANAILNSGTLIFAGGGLQRTSTADLGTVAQLLAGDLAAAVALNPSFSWSDPQVGVTFSDRLDLTNTAGTAQYLGLTYDPTAGGDVMLGWFDTSASAWVNAIDGNTGGTPQFYAGSWNSFIAANPEATIANSLGVYGRDTATNTVWAVVNHNSEYAAIILVPEPGAMALAALGLAGVAAARRRAKRRGASAAG